MQRPSRCRTPRSAVKRRRLRTRAERRTGGREDGTGPRNGRIPPKFSGSGEEGSVRSSTTEISRCLRVTPLLVPRSIAVGLPFFSSTLDPKKAIPPFTIQLWRHANTVKSLSLEKKSTQNNLRRCNLKCVWSIMKLSINGSSSIDIALQLCRKQ